MSELPKRYRKKPMEVEAVRWDGMNQEQIEAFIGDGAVRFLVFESSPIVSLRIGCAFLSDFIVRENHSLRVYSRADFEATYEAVS